MKATVTGIAPRSRDMRHWRRLPARAIVGLGFFIGMVLTPHAPLFAHTEQAGTLAAGVVQVDHYLHDETRWWIDRETADTVCMIWLAPVCEAFSSEHLLALSAAGEDTVDAVHRYLTSRGRRLLAVLSGPLLSDGATALLLLGTEQGCASCPPHWIAVWSLQRQGPLWEADDGVNTIVSLVDGGGGFVRSDSVRLGGEASCCPSTREQRTLTWDGATFRSSD
jgi:hypothetical protein